jgi:multisubunit Na+/H+ antiporter MnhG subunit
MLGRMKGNIYLFRGIGRGTGNVVLGGIIAVAGYTAGSLAFGIALILIAVFALVTSPSIRNAGYH